MGRKKEIEQAFFEEARKSTSMFPEGEFTPSERPDFVQALGHGTLGVEMTELCLPDARKAGARLSHVMPEARKLYDAMPDAKPVWVSFGFVREGRNKPVKELSTALAQFVHEHRYQYDNYFWDKATLPDGFFHIGIWEPVGPFPWFHSATHETKLVGADLVQSVISDKNEHVADYRKAADEVWLLIVNDLFLGAGEVAVHGKTIAECSFEFDFDKVLLFQRQPGGSGKVIELQRAVSRAA